MWSSVTEKRSTPVLLDSPSWTGTTACPPDFADPQAETGRRLWGHEDAFSPATLSNRFRLGKPTFAGTRGNEQDAPTPDLPALAPRRGCSTPYRTLVAASGSISLTTDCHPVTIGASLSLGPRAGRQAARTQSASNPLKTGARLCSMVCCGSRRSRGKRSNSAAIAIWASARASGAPRQ